MATSISKYYAPCVFRWSSPMLFVWFGTDFRVFACAVFIGTRVLPIYP